MILKPLSQKGSSTSPTASPSSKLNILPPLSSIKSAPKPTPTKTVSAPVKKVSAAPIKVAKPVVKAPAPTVTKVKAPQNIFQQVGSAVDKAVHSPIGGGASLADTYNQALKDISHGFAAPAGESTPKAPKAQNKSVLETKSKTTTAINKAVPRFADDVTALLTSTLKGATGGAFKGTVKDINPEVHIIKPIGEIAGQTFALEKLGSGVNAILGKTPIATAFNGTKLAFIPSLLSNTVSFDIYGQLDPQTKNRMKHLINDSEQGLLLTAIGAIGKAKVSVPLAFGSGVALAKINGATNKDALVSGVVFASLEMGNKIPGLFSAKPKQEYTPQEARNYVMENKLENTPKGNKIIMNSFDAQTQGKNLQLEGSKITLINPGEGIAMQDLVDKYIAKHGNVVDSDRAKELLPGYTPDKAPEFHKQSQQVRDEVYKKLLVENRGVGNDTVSFTAGGAASGKSESIGVSTKNDAIAYDTTLSSPARVSDVKKALANGYNIRIEYTASDPVAAWDRVQVRGRKIPLGSFVRDYEQSLQNVKNLYSEYKNNPKATFRFTDNTGAMGEAKPTTFAEIKKIVYNKDTILNEIRNNEINNTTKQTRTGSPIGQTPQGVNNINESRNEAQVPSKTPSKIASSIERKAIEQKLTKGFEGVAGYDKITIQDQAQKAADLMANIDEARQVIRGEKPLPTGLRGTALITAAEENIARTGNAQLAYELANSPLVSETSAAAQELRLAAERQPDSLALKLRDVKRSREIAVEKKTGLSVDKAIKREVENIKARVKKPDKYDWNSFISSIQC